MEKEFSSFDIYYTKIMALYAIFGDRFYLQSKSFIIPYVLSDTLKMVIKMVNDPIIIKVIMDQTIEDFPRCSPYFKQISL